MQATEQRETNSQVSRLTEVVDRLGYQLIAQASQHISDRLSEYMALPHQLNQMNADLIAAGQLNPNDPIACEQHFWRQAKLFKNISYIGHALIDGSKESGAGRWINGVDLAVYENRNLKGFDYAADEQGNRTHLIQSYDYDPFEQPCHKSALEHGKPMWSEIYTADIAEVEVAIDANCTSEATAEDAVSNNLGYEYYVAVNAEHPIYNKQGQLFGLVVVDVLLVDISQLLRCLKVTPAGQVFIIERNGLLIGSSEKQPILHKVDGRAERFSTIDTPNSMIRAIAGELQKRFNPFQAIHDHLHFDFCFDGERQLVQVTPWQDEYGLDWLLIVSVPETDLIA